MSIKIWIWHSGTGGEGSYVRLKLRVGEAPLHIFSVGPDEEGWSSRAERWWVEDGNIHNEVVTDGRDCDGRLSTYHRHICPVEARHARPNVEGWLMPAWQVAESGQRDYAAEAAGY